MILMKITMLVKVLKKNLNHNHSSRRAKNKQYVISSREILVHALNVFLHSLMHVSPGFSIDLNFQDVMTSKLKNLDVSVQNLEVMQ